jgi:hypothetical protein
MSYDKTGYNRIKQNEVKSKQVVVYRAQPRPLWFGAARVVHRQLPTCMCASMLRATYGLPSSLECVRRGCLAVCLQAGGDARSQPITCLMRMHSAACAKRILACECSGGEGAVHMWWGKRPCETGLLACAGQPCMLIQTCMQLCNACQSNPTYVGAALV